MKIEIKEECYWYIHDCILVYGLNQNTLYKKRQRILWRTGYIERILVLLLYSFIDQPTSLLHRQNIISYNKDKNLKQNLSLLDPCSNTFEHDILTDDGFRSPACRRSQSEPRCDDNIVEGWYVLHSSDGSTTLRVHRECPRQSRCGTDNPIWMNGG